MASLLASLLMNNSAGIYPPMRGSPATRRKRRKVAKVARRKVARATKRNTSRVSARRPGRLVKGSAAAKRYMASIRRKRRR